MLRAFPYLGNRLNVGGGSKTAATMRASIGWMKF